MAGVFLDSVLCGECGLGPLAMEALQAVDQLTNLIYLIEFTNLVEDARATPDSNSGGSVVRATATDDESMSDMGTRALVLIPFLVYLTVVGLLADCIAFTARKNCAVCRWAFPRIVCCWQCWMALVPYSCVLMHEPRNWCCRFKPKHADETWKEKFEARQAFVEDYLGGLLLLIAGIVHARILANGSSNYWCERECGLDDCGTRGDISNIFTEYCLEKWGCNELADGEFAGPSSCPAQACINECQDGSDSRFAQSMVLVAFGITSSVLSLVARFASARRNMTCATRAERAAELNSKIQELYLGEPIGIGPFTIPTFPAVASLPTPAPAPAMPSPTMYGVAPPASGAAASVPAQTMQVEVPANAARQRMMQVQVPMTTGVEGMQLQVQTPDGQQIAFTVPAGTDPGAVLSVQY